MSINPNIKELSNEEMRKKGLIEYSSIGGKIRRKAESIDFEMLTQASKENGATQIALTFCEHYDPEINNARHVSQVTKKVWSLIDEVQKVTNVPVTILNTGKPFDCMIYLPDEGVNIEFSHIRGEIDFSNFIL